MLPLVFGKNKNTEGLEIAKAKCCFIDARKLGTMVDRVVREFSVEDTAQISDTYHAWRGEKRAIEQRGAYEDISGFCYSASLEDIKTNGYVLTPGRFVGAEDEIDDGVPFEEKFEALKERLEQQFFEGQKLADSITLSLTKVAND